MLAGVGVGLFRDHTSAMQGFVRPTRRVTHDSVPHDLYTAALPECVSAALRATGARQQDPRPVSRRIAVTFKLDRMRIEQVAMVVADLEAAVAMYHDTMGWGPWNIYEYRKPRFHDALVRGEAAEFTYIGAETMVGDLWIELLQPLDGDSPLTNGWPRTATAACIISVTARGAWRKRPRSSAQFEAAGSTVLMEGWIDRIYFFYMDMAVVTGAASGIRAARRRARSSPRARLSDSLIATGLALDETRSLELLGLGERSP